MSSSSATTVASVMKYGMIAIISITFITSLKKFNLFGQAKNLSGKRKNKSGRDSDGG